MAIRWFKSSLITCFSFLVENARALKTGLIKKILTISDYNSILTPVFKGNLFPSVVKEKIQVH